MKLLQINSTANSGSTGQIAENIGLTAMEAGHKSYIAAANTNQPSQSEIIKIGNEFDRKLHGCKTRLFDRHGFGSANVTRHLIKKIKNICPDIIHLHNIHGYYLNVAILFKYLKNAKIPVVWTFHDCWPFTGHCSHFERVNCYKWQSECNACPNLKGYPASWGLDNSRKNFRDKNRIFNGLQNLQIVTPSNWLKKHVKNSFLKHYPVQTIHNGIDLNIFKPIQRETTLKKYGLEEKHVILGVANTWKKRKAFEDFIKLSNQISNKEQIVLVGLSQKQLKNLPVNITGVPRTENISELAALYSAASVFVNPTYVDNFPTTNIEALACGTPVVTYNTGGSPEAIDKNTGFVVEKGNLKALNESIEKILVNGKESYQEMCRIRAEQMYNKVDRYQDYLSLLEKILR